MTNSNVLPFRQKEKFYPSDNLQPCRAGQSWIDFLGDWEMPIFRLYCGRYNLQFSNDLQGYFWKSWKSDDYGRTVKFSTRCIVGVRP